MLAHDEKLWLLRINSFTGGAPRELLETIAAHARERSFAKASSLREERLARLERWLIPAFPRQIRHTSSRPPHFRGEGPAVDVVDPQPCPGNQTRERGKTFGGS